MDSADRIRLLQHFLNFLLLTCGSNYRVAGRRHREAGSGLGKFEKKKCMSLGNLHCATGRADLFV